MRTTRTTVLALALASAAMAEPPPTPEPITRFDGDVVVRATLRSANDLMLMGQLSDDAWSHSPGIGGASDWRLPRDRRPVAGCLRSWPSRSPEL